MNPALAALVLQYAIQYGIPAAREIVIILHKPAPTLDDWNHAFTTAESAADKFLADTAPKVA